VQLDQQVSTRRIVAVLLAAALAAIVVPVGVEAAGPALVRLVDGDSATKVQVDGGKVRVGDGSGAVTTDAKPAQLLVTGECGPGDEEFTIPAGSTVTTIFSTGTSSQYPGHRLDIFQGDNTGTALMSLKVSGGSGNVGDQNAIYSSDIGFKITGATPWSVVCGGMVQGNGTNGGLFSIFGYPPA
jgi:hypothetical protein